MPNVQDFPDGLLQMGWYLDTSLLMDFIDRNVRVGFDTAEPYDGKSIIHLKGVPKSGRVMVVPILSGEKRFQFELTSSINDLRMLHYTSNTLYYYSELTKAEVFRSLRKAHTQRSESEISNWWDALTFLMGKYQKVEIDVPIGEELSKLALTFPIRKNVQDYLHLIIAKKKELAYITSDKLDDQIEELKVDYYQHIYYWPQLKEKLPLDAQFRL